MFRFECPIQRFDFFNGMPVKKKTNFTCEFKSYLGQFSKTTIMSFLRKMEKAKAAKKKTSSQNQACNSTYVTEELGKKLAIR